MKANESPDALRAFAAAKGIELNASTPREGIDSMLEFHKAVPCENCAEDTLLYQWGSYDWGAGKYFELNITRQFIEAGLEGDDAISQLSLTYKYKPSIESERLDSGNGWSDGPEEFRQSILASPAFLMVADIKADQVELVHSPV